MNRSICLKYVHSCFTIHHLRIKLKSKCGNIFAAWRQHIYWMVTVWSHKYVASFGVSKYNNRNFKSFHSKINEGSTDAHCKINKKIKRVFTVKHSGNKQHCKNQAYIQ